MQTRTRRRWFIATAVAMAWVLGASGRGQAQLFPNLPIQRPKVPCDQEAPYYKVFRQHYHGYFPTCWRAFPKGWGCPCPNPEKPDWEAEKKREPVQTDLDYFDPGGPRPDDEGGPGDMQGPAPRRGAQPELPPARSPFDLDDPNPARGGRNPAGATRRGTSAPRAANPNLSPIPDSLPLMEFPGPDATPRGTSSVTNRQDPTVDPTSVYVAPPVAKRNGWLGGLLNMGRR